MICTAKQQQQIHSLQSDLNIILHVFTVLDDYLDEMECLYSLCILRSFTDAISSSGDNDDCSDPLPPVHHRPCGQAHPPCSYLRLMCIEYIFFLLSCAMYHHCATSLLLLFFSSVEAFSRPEGLPISRFDCDCEIAESKALTWNGERDRTGHSKMVEPASCK